MTCLHCHTRFEATKEEQDKCTLADVPYCSWECFRDDERGLRWHPNALTRDNRNRLFSGKRLKDEKKIKVKYAGYYHEGPRDPTPGTKEAMEAENAYRRKMANSCSKRPPKVGHSGFGSDGHSTPTLLPSEIYFGKAKTRVLDPDAGHIGGEEGEKFNFEGE